MKFRRLRDAPFVIDSLPFWIDEDTSLLSVVCKATYTLREGQCSFAPRPIEIFADEQYVGASGTLYAPRDLLPAKAHPEVIVVWQASPKARLTLEGANVPLRPPMAKINGQTLPPSAQLASHPLGELDAERYQFAAREQWLDNLPIGAPFTLHDAHPRLRSLTTRLPRHQPIVRVEGTATTSFVVPLRSELLWLDVEQDLLTVTWRGQLHGFDDSLVLALGVDDGQRAAWPQSPKGPSGLPQTGCSTSSMETTVTRDGQQASDESPRDVAKGSRSRQTQAIRAVGSQTSPGTPQSDGLPKWLDNKPSSRPSLPAQDHGRAYSSAPPPPPDPRSASAHPSPVPGPFPSRPTAPYASPSVSPPSAAGMTAPELGAGPPDGWTDSAPPPPHAHGVVPPNPALAMIDAPQEMSPSPIFDEETSGVRQSYGAETLALDLLWARDDCTSHMVDHRALARFLPEVPEPPPPSAPAPILGIVPRDPSPPTAVEPDESVVRRALRGAEATGLFELHDRLVEFAHDETQPDRVVVMLRGELVIGYDQRAALQIMTDTARPLADPKSGELASAVDHAEKVIDTPLAEDPGILESVTTQLLDAWRSKKRELPKNFLAEHTRRLLLKHRHHDERKVLGASCVRAFFRHGTEEVPVYLAPPIEPRLPSMFGFEARVLAKIVPRQDELEACCVALVPLAVARVLEDADER